VSLCGGQ